MKRILHTLLLFMLVLCAAGESGHAQWKFLTQLTGTRGASAFFFNATEGVIGTGDYNPFRSLPAKIFYTNDGGTTWQNAVLPNDQIIGQVTDIYFRDRLHGWATIKESFPKGWSGIYRSTDGGRSWNLIKTAAYPFGIRETKRGVFYTDHGDVQSYPYYGVVFSGDQGKTWSLVGSAGYPLGIDFIDDAYGYASGTGGPTEPHIATTDSGRTWSVAPSDSSEAWSVYGDRFSRNFLIASERAYNSSITAILKSPAASPNPVTIRTYGLDGLSGGVAGSGICRSIVYVQGQPSHGVGPLGIIRTMDGGANWKFVGGPMNTNDTRFAVTGRGAVVYAFDTIGNIYKTMNGGDSTLSPSVMQYVTIAPAFTTTGYRCDSSYANIVFGYRACDSSRIAGIRFLNDTLHELSAPGYANDFGFFTQSHVDTLHILYQSALERSWTAQIRITIAQPDGYLEDTVISIRLTGLPPRNNVVTFLDTTSPKQLSFDSVSICASDVHKVTLANRICADLSIDNLQTSGDPFSLASSFRPFVLSGGSSRTFLLRYSPTAPQSDNGALYVYHGTKIDTLALSGIGYTPSRAVVLAVADTISSSLCDSANFSINIRNVSCKPFAIRSVVADTPFTSLPISGMDSLHSGESAQLRLSFKPTSQGPAPRQVRITISYEGSGEYDTTLTLIGNGTSGLPDFTISSTSALQVSTRDLGDLSICSDAFDTLVLTGTGCGETSFDSAQYIWAQGGYDIMSVIAGRTLAGGQRDTILLRYHPSVPGKDSSQFHIWSSAGEKTIAYYINVTNDPGHVVLASPQNVSSLTCDSAAFGVSVTNSTCDSITIIAFHISGADSNDFALAANLPVGLATRGQVSINGMFKPQDSLQRNATAVLTIKRADGTVTDTTLLISALGIGVPAIPVALANTHYSAIAGAHIHIPVYALVASRSPLGTLDFALDMHTDLLTPLDIVPGVGAFGAASTHSITSTGASAQVHLQLASDALIPAGKICEIDCEAFISDTFATNISLMRPNFATLGGTTGCLLTQSVTDSAPSFTLIAACGDSTLKDFIKYGTLLLDRVSPNPTSGLVALTFSVPPTYQNDGVVEVYDALGEQLLAQPLIFAGAGQQMISLDLGKTSGDGMRYLLIHTPTGIITRDVMVLSEPELR
ncbi:MAG: choice-of-anchor D domain-containing protein [Bacteroidota bacterium]|nr:choice-of-anchor D domain-containing protein [Bacteroidota bacterium]MDP4231850.1 choice-of-anchor D domain-containing protein [Bacteroidota bacterium]MDP4242736.1 choice-of-anchor D domain-containing protein [Bacteroidota bacterium]MDP4287187.1 choice-of-anchor D domain-containing protein [Bacteroidota bacterium]